MRARFSDRLSVLIGDTYDAAFDDAGWKDLAPKIADTFESPSSTLSLQNRSAGTVLRLTQTANYTDSLIAAHRDYFYKRDIWVEKVRERSLSRVFASNDLLTDTEFERTEFCQDFIRKLGIFYVVGSVFAVSESELGVLGIHRPRSDGTYEERDKQKVARFLPHLERALQMRRHLLTSNIERRAALESLEHSATAMVVVTRSARLLYANVQGEALLARGDGLTVVQGRLASSDRLASERMSRLIRRVVDTASDQPGSPGGRVLILRDERPPISVLVAPLRPSGAGIGAAVPAAILFVRDPEYATPQAAALRELFGLTPAEASLAAALARGQSLDRVATSQGITLHTARGYLKSVFAKTGTNRQSQLVALIMASMTGG
jgi:DNA-binding CsgD family transcriptional regulator